jgi:hypothetical protein
VSAETESRAEVAKLARVLGLGGPAALAHLLQVPARELCDYREAVTVLLFERDAELLRHAAEAAHLIPLRTLAVIGERALGPLVCARLTGLLEPERAAEVSEHMSVGFLARLAAELDPRRIIALLAAMPAERVLDVALAMAADGEHVAMGRFVAHLDEPTLAACVARLGDEDILRISFTLEGKERLVQVVEFAGLERTRRMLAAAESLGLQEEAGDLLDHLGARRRRELARALRAG